ncbi:MAG: glycosyltransferase family 4 protein [Deltaproteobacteria bacterium]|nr:MAG: glycosyltransferase family 4 protein [Deltaproteobacteria bacterium]
MRIAYLVNQYPTTSHSFIRREIHALEAQGVEVLRFSIQPLREQLVNEADRLERGRTRVVLGAGAAGHALSVLACAVRRPAAALRALILAIRLGWRSDRGLLRHLAYLAESCVLTRWLQRAGADHVHAHFGTNPAMVAMLCRELGGPTFSFTVHGPEEFDKPQFLGLREKVQRAAFVVAISSFGRGQLYRWARSEDWPKIEVVRCGVDEDLLRAPAAPVPADPRLVCVARIAEQKGHLLLVEAAALLAAEGLDFQIVLVGEGPMRHQVEELIQRRGLTDRFLLTGRLDGRQVREAILGSRALVLPSFAEGLPVVVMEALALRRPVIATAIAGNPELLEAGVTGWLVPAGSVEALAGAMRAALQASPVLLEEMGRAGAVLIALQHDVSREARKLAMLFGSTRDRVASGAVCAAGGSQPLLRD